MSLRLVRTAYCHPNRRQMLPLMNDVFITYVGNGDSSVNPVLHLFCITDNCEETFGCNWIEYFVRAILSQLIRHTVSRRIVGLFVSTFRDRQSCGQVNHPVQQGCGLQGRRCPSRWSQGGQRPVRDPLRCVLQQADRQRVRWDQDNDRAAQDLPE